MRDVKFRGRFRDNGDWVYGNLIGSDVIVGGIVEWDSDYFCTEFWMKVDTKTVGEFTGLKDRNRKDIYEGDIVEGEHRAAEFIMTNRVSFLNGCFMFGNWNAHEYFNKHTGIRVIGNIHENPDLLEKEDKPCS